MYEYHSPIRKALTLITYPLHSLKRKIFAELPDLIRTYEQQADGSRYMPSTSMRTLSAFSFSLSFDELSLKPRTPVNMLFLQGILLDCQ